jgi:glutamine---fructose-6-phosphate transaminase (isomerizing)
VIDHPPVPGALMAAELAEQPAVLGRLADRHAVDRDRVRAALPPGHAGTVLLARGSSDNVAVYGRYLIEMASGRPAGLAAPSLHTRYQADVDYRGYLAVALSQSGATPEVVQTAAAMRRAGAVVVGITNEADSPLTEACQLTLLTDAGPELAVPATKTVTAQMLAVAAIAAAFDSPLVTDADLGALPDAVAALLADPGPGGSGAGGSGAGGSGAGGSGAGGSGAGGSGAGGPAAVAGPAYAVATRWADARRLVVTGRGLAYAAALETALKIKETARVHAEGLSSADLLHGPIAALDSRLPVLVVSGGARFAADEAELAARLSADGVPFAVCGAASTAELPLPPGISEVTAPILATVRGQQLALASSLLRGLNPDAPAGLSKVTATH